MHSCRKNQSYDENPLEALRGLCRSGEVICQCSKYAYFKVKVTTQLIASSCHGVLGDGTAFTQGFSSWGKQSTIFSNVSQIFNQLCELHSAI